MQIRPTFGARACHCIVSAKAVALRSASGSSGVTQTSYTCTAKPSGFDPVFGERPGPTASALFGKVSFPAPAWRTKAMPLYLKAPMVCAKNPKVSVVPVRPGIWPLMVMLAIFPALPLPVSQA